MTTPVDDQQTSSGRAPGEIAEPDRLDSEAKTCPELSGKVVFVTVKGSDDARAVIAKYARAGAHVAALDIDDWGLLLLRAGDKADCGPPIPCRSWTDAVEESIALLGPIDLWIDTRPMNWVAANRPDESA